jgi:hypothetical protein
MRRADTIGAPSVFVNKNGLGRFPEFRDQGVGGSNPLSPTISEETRALKKLPATADFLWFWIVSNPIRVVD